MGAPLIGELMFDINGNGILGDTTGPFDARVSDYGTTTNRAGEYGPAAAGRLSASTPPGDPSRVFHRVGGISSQTGFLYTQILAPMDGTIASPVTYLLGHEHTDKLLKNAGIDLTPRQLRTFDAYGALSSADAAQNALARQITALNFKLIVHAGYEINEDSAQAIQLHPNLEGVRLQLDTGSVNFNDAASVRAILDRSKIATRTDAEGRRAAAQLIARFGEAVDRYLTGPDRIAAVEYGMRLTVLPELKWVFAASSRPASDIAKLDALTVDALLKAFADFEEIPRPNTATGSFIAVPDWLPYGATRFAPSNFVYNDPTIDFGVGVFALTNQLIAVRVPPKFAAELDVTLEPDGTVYVKRSGPETSQIWFEYDARNAAGQIATSRAYLAARRY